MKILERLAPTAWLEMNPRDTRRLSLQPHDRVRVVSPRSHVDDLELRITEIVAPGQVFMPLPYCSLPCLVSASQKPWAGGSPW